MKYVSPFALALSCLLAGTGCGSQADEDGTDADPQTGDPSDPAEPGKNVCNINSNYPGDELCILPPAPEEGIQLHAGPTDYDDPDEVAPWLIAPGQEDVRCFLADVPRGGFYYLNQKNRMRSGSHHMLIFLEAPEGRSAGPASSGCEITGSIGGVPGSQTPSSDIPGGELAPEDTGLARFFPTDTIAAFQLHYVNTGTETFMREAWVNLYEKPESEVTDRLQGMFLVGDFGVNVLPKTRETTKLAYTPNLPGPVRIFQMNGHSHAHTETFTVWRRPQGGERELLYKSFDWAEPDSLTFNTTTTNSPPNEAAKTDGGFSGTLMFNPGDSIEWECEVNNTSDQPLRFANEAYTAEMCLLAGSYVSPTGGHFRAGCLNGSCLGGGARR